MHVEFSQQVLSIGEHIHQVRDRSPLVAADITDATLQQRLGNRQNPLAMEFCPGAKSQFLYFMFERTFSHRCQRCR